MPSVCFYFQMHQPVRLRRYSVFDTDPHYFDDKLNTAVLRKVAAKSYEPTTRLLLDLIRRHQGRFRISLSVTGVLMEQLKQLAPSVIENLRRLAETGHVEFISETYYHSLAFLYSRDEFGEQVAQHQRMIQDLFGQTPTVFRNTELIYNNDLAGHLQKLGKFRGVLTEGADRILAGRTSNQPYGAVNANGLAVLLRNYRLSDDIGFRFSNHTWPEYPLTAPKYANWISRICDPLVNLFLDFETFGEHQWADTGIFQFLEALPAALLDAGCDFKTVSQALEGAAPTDRFDAPQMISWADTERDLSAWLGNAMQSNAMQELYKLEAPVKASGDAQLIEDWRRLTISDHAYYMCTKYYNDAVVHSYFNPYESPYDSYINFMNVLENLRGRVVS